MTGEAIARVRARRSGNLTAIRPKGSAAMSDIDTLERLNRDYISSVQNCDVARFNEILAPEFYCSNPDGTLIDRAAFLKQTAIPVTITGLEARDVVIRLFGPPGQENIAIIHARTAYKTADGAAKSGRYTDVWARQGGTWLAVSAHVTRG
jgi:ketosteroid isomerase-like protein